MSNIKLQGEFGAAYVKAVAHAAGYFVEPAGRWADEAGIDLTILSLTESGLRKSPRLDVQVKTTIAPLEGDPFPYDLAANNYNQLCDTSPNNLPSILVLVSVPELHANWSTATAEQLVLRNCGYWKSLRGEAATDNTATKRITIARSAIFLPDVLRTIMTGIAEGRLP